MGEKIRPDKASTEGGTCTAQAPPSAAAGPVFPSFFSVHLQKISGRAGRRLLIKILGTVRFSALTCEIKSYRIIQWPLSGYFGGRNKQASSGSRQAAEGKMIEKELNECQISAERMNRIRTWKSGQPGRQTKSKMDWSG